MQNFIAAEFIERLKKVLKIKTDTELNDYLGVGKNSVGVWKHRNTIDFLFMITFCNKNNININYLLTGEGDPYNEDIAKLKEKLTECEATIKKMEEVEKLDNREALKNDMLYVELNAKIEILQDTILKRQQLNLCT